MFEGADKFLDSAGKVLDTVPEIYGDGIKATVTQTGNFLGRIPRAINAALSPLDIWIANREYAVEETKKLLAIKLDKIDPEKIVSPEPYVAVPAIQALSYSMDSEELRNMYANLIARSMNMDEKINVHPSFVDIIKQISPLDANVLKSICESDVRPIISFVSKSVDGKGEKTLARHLTWLPFATMNHISVSLDNLQKCGLIQILDDKSYVEKSNYDHVRKSRFYLSVRDTFKDSADRKTIEKEGHIEITDYGMSFFNICVKDV